MQTRFATEGLFPLLFVLVANGLSRMITKAREVKLLEGINGSKSIKLINLQYADDTLLFGTTDIRQGIELKWILCCFEAWLTLRINLKKTIIVNLGWENITFSMKRSIFWS